MEFPISISWDVMGSTASCALGNHHQKAPVFYSFDTFVKKKSHNLCKYVFNNMYPVTSKDTCVKHTSAVK